MNRILIFLCFLCIPWAVRGQSAYEWVYWFDNDDSRQYSGTGQGNSITINAVVDGLTEGIHAFHVQVADTAGKYSPPQTQIFCHVAGQNVKYLRYWFDEDSEAKYIINNLGEVAMVDVSELSVGFHTIHCQLIGDVPGNVISRMFINVTDQSVSDLRYWYDEDNETKLIITNPDEVVMVDVSELSEGFHTIHCQLTGDGNVMSRMFIKIPQIENAGMMTCICTVDEKLVAQQKVSASGGIISWQMDVDSLDVGLHRAVFQVITATGAASTIAERYFVRVVSDKEMSKMKCVYSVDNFQTHSAQGVGSNGQFHFDLDVSALDDGLHRLSYMMVAEDGTTTPQKTAFFWKAPLGEEGITHYEYWINDDEEHIRRVELDKCENPFKLISLLPFDTQPIRSSSFHFELKDNNPVIYAKNDFHIRFYDSADYFSDAYKSFVDYNVKQDVVDIIPLSRLKTNTVGRTDKNEIRWFSFEAERGDTIAFKASQATCLQVFAPNGEEVYSAVGSESVKYGGCHTWQEGTYYLAMHDVTGSKPNVSIDFFHLAPHDVVRQDVRIVGNGGCSTITFEGNGFRDLYAVDLFNEQGDSIKHIYIGHESDATTSVAYDFTGAVLGDYHAKFYFTGEDKVFKNLVTVEEPRDIELATTVTYPSSFLRGTSTTYTIKITNKGNMTAYNVPLSIKISNSVDNDISRVALDGLGLKKLFDYVEDYEGWMQSEIESFRLQCDAIGEDHYFVKVKTANEKGDSIFVRTGLFGLSVPPNTTKTISLILTASENVEVWVATAKEVPILTSVTYAEEATSRLQRRVNVEYWKNLFCCHYEQIVCVGSIIVNIADIASLAVGTPVGQIAAAVSCITGLLNEFLTASGKALCNRQEVENSLKEQIYTVFHGMSIAGTVLSCASKILGDRGKISEFVQILMGAIDVSTLDVGNYLCVEEFTKTKPGCPPNPGGGGGISYSVVSMDPNDIYGYTASSGTHAVKDGLTDVYYRIEFENDTTFATAAAHEIVVTDTLDATKFDLSTFAPTRVRIGDKSAELNGDKNFVTTIDMRPEINAIAQVEGTFDEQKGIAKWHITSLDPMTMEPTDDVMQGVLPVNYDGSGIGEVSYDISLKPDLAHGTEVKNRAAIVFDTNDVIMTPTWTNIIDRIAPESHITDVQLLNDSTATVSIEASDELSGPWRYDVYVQYGSGAWFKAAENVAVDTTASVKIYEGMEHHFYCVVTDSAGNVEQKVAECEFTLEVLGSQRGDVNKDGAVDIADVVAVYNIMAGNNPNGLNGDVNKDGATDIADVVAVYNIMAGGHVVNAVRSGQRPVGASQRSKQTVPKK